jgi:DNA sulfur modification protein DndD
MILEHLTLKNFCLFGGEQVFNLTPGRQSGRHLPVILFGGINGGGKTTLLDAVQFALYGPRARCSKRANLSYEDYLRQCIHEGAAPAEGAAVALSFRYAADGEECVYDVARSWHFATGRLREQVRVYRDGLPGEWLSENWGPFAEELFPLEISQLFFFDAEKIRTLAQDETSSKALGAAIKAVLGLDIVERLIADAAIVQARLAKKEGTPEQRAEAEALENQMGECQQRVETLVAERAALENRVLRAETESKEAEAEFAAAGGKHWEARQAREKRLAELAALERDLEARLVVLASGELPLVLVGPLLEQVAEQDAREHAQAEAEITARLLAERDSKLLEVLQSGRPPAKLLRLIMEYLEADRQARQVHEPVERRLELSETGRALLARLRGQELTRLRAEVQRLEAQSAEVGREHEDLERAEARMPAETDIARLVERFKQATQAHTVLEHEARRMDGEIERRKAELKTCQAKLAGLAQGRVEKEFAAEDVRRMIVLAGRTRETMQLFLHRVTDHKIDRLSALITESFRFLLRKQALVERIAIDPATFAITLYDRAGQAVPKERLSEGEKQIFAISVLWGLARASARPLPALIDTPMARLDATHRHHLVERYFPNASHQVVLFSTDTEVDRHYYRLLQPSIARVYHLNYDEGAKLTIGEEGYFWQEPPVSPQTGEEA